MNRFNLLALLALVFLLSSCAKKPATIDWEGEFSKHGALGQALTYFADEQCVGTCQWRRIDDETLEFEGTIKEGSYQEFMQKIDDKVKEIRLNSSGGIVQFGLKIGEEIYRRKIKVRVTGFCISSCANYLFLAGDKKIIEGVVGFHGSSQAAIKKSKYCEKDATRRGCDFAILEHQFFKKIGIAEAIFDLTQSREKGMADGRSYAYYAPSKATLSKLGVSSIEGEQNAAYLEKMAHLEKKFNDNYFAVARDPNPGMERLLRLPPSE